MLEFRRYNKVAGIYKWENKINHKCYIGQSIDIGSRLRHHINNYNKKRYNNPLYMAFEKYGLDNFDVEILFEISNPESCIKPLLDRLEIGYIEAYNSYGSTGYNQTRGGDGGILGYKFTEEQRKHVSENSKKQAVKLFKKVYLMNLYSEEILEFESVQKAADYFKLPHSSITRVCNWQQYTVKLDWIGSYEIETLSERADFIKSRTSNVSNKRKFIQTHKGSKRHFNTPTGKKIIPQTQRDKIRNSLFKYKVEIYEDDILIKTYANTLESNEFFNLKDPSRIANSIRKYNRFGYKFKKRYTVKLVETATEK